MTRGYFVTGTDTGVGKTFVATALARHAVSLGRRVFAFKPIETGCKGEGDDQRLLCAAAGDWQRGPQRGLYQFRQPAAPLVAAAAEARTIDCDAIVELVRSTPSDLTIVEGAGGWRVPVTDTADMSVLARHLGLPIILVARAGLGTINHTLLSAEAIARDGCTLATVLLSLHPHDDRTFALSNAAQLSRFLPVHIFDGGPAPFSSLLS